MASHRRGWETVGGCLYLTDRRLLFHPHSLNVQIEGWSVGLVEIEDVRECLTLGIIPNGLSVVTLEGDERFLVWDRRGWEKEVWQAIHDAEREDSV